MNEFKEVRDKIKKRELMDQIDTKIANVEDKIKIIKIKKQYDIDITLDDLYEVIQEQQDLIIDMAKVIVLNG